MCYLPKKQKQKTKQKTKTKRGSRFAKPYTLAKNAIDQGLDGSKLMRDVLELKKYGVGGNTSLSRSTEAAALNVASETRDAINYMDNREQIE